MRIFGKYRLFNATTKIYKGAGEKSQTMSSSFGAVTMLLHHMHNYHMH